MKLKKENLLQEPSLCVNDEEEHIPRRDRIEIRAMQLFKIAEFLNEYFDGKYTEELFQCRCQWCRVQLDTDFFKKLTEAAENKDLAKRQEIMKELHIYVEDFLIAFCEEFFKVLKKTSKNFIIYAGHLLHSRMEVKRLEKFLYLTGMLKEKA